jgi:predicted Zn-dependent protease
MKKIFFWKNFYGFFSKFYISYLIFTAILLVAMACCYIMGEQWSIGFEYESAIESIPTRLSEFNRGLFQYKVEAESMFIKEFYLAQNFSVPPWISYIFLIVLMISFMILYTIVSFIEGWWYYVCMLFFMLWMVLFKIEFLQLFHFSSQYISFSVVILFSAINYYFKSLQPHRSFFSRLLVFLLLSFLLSCCISYGAQVPYPFLWLSNTNILIPLSIVLVFVCMNSIEPIALFVTITASNKLNTDKTRLRNFLIISVLYLANLFLMLFKKWGVIDWEIVKINMFLLTTISMLLGIWGFKKRAHLYKDILPFNPLGAIAYLAVASMAIATFSYIFISHNLPLIDALESILLYIHVSFGLLAFVYTIINFAFIYNKNVSIDELFYVPRRFPFFMVHIAGAVIATILLLRGNLYPFFQTMAAHYNFYGDYYHQSGNSMMAKEYYFNAVSYDRYNQRSNYSIGTIAQSQGKNNEAQEYFNAGMVKKAFEHTYTNLAHLYLNNDMLLQAMFTLEDGLKVYPQSESNLNNLGMYFQQSKLQDSSLYYLIKAYQVAQVKDVPLGNLLFLLSKNNFLHEADSLSLIPHDRRNLKLETNLLGVKNLVKRKNDASAYTLSNADAISPFEYSLIFNDIVNAALHHEKSKSFDIEKLINGKNNDAYQTGLKFLQAIENYYHGNKEKGMNILESIYHQTNLADYAQILAIWYFEQEAYDLAYDYFNYSIEKYGEQSVLNCAVALCENNQYDRAKSNLDLLSKSQNPEVASIAKIVQDIYQFNPETIISQSDKSKYQWLHFKRQGISKEQIFKVCNSIDTFFYKNIAISEMVLELLKKGEVSAAQELWKNINSIPKDHNFEKGLIDFAQANLLLQSGQWKQLDAKLEKMHFNSDKLNTKKYFKAKISEFKNNLSNTIKLYAEAIKDAPTNQELILNYTQFLIKHNKMLEAHELLAKSIKQNNYSVPLLKQYIEVASVLDFTSYANDAKEKLKSMMDSKDYQVFVSNIKN